MHQEGIGDPGQATAYKIGEIRLREIRQKAERELGDRFDVVSMKELGLDGSSLSGLVKGAAEAEAGKAAPSSAPPKPAKPKAIARDSDAGVPPTGEAAE